MPIPVISAGVETATCSRQAGSGGATMRQCAAMRRDLRQLRDMRNNAINTN